MGKDLITITSFYTVAEAHMAKAKLDSAGIFAAVFNEHIIGMEPYFADLYGGVKVKVMEKDLEDACSILGLGGAKASKEREVQESWGICPNCAGKDVEYISDKKGFSLSGLFFGIPFLPVRDRVKCRACGHIWEYKQ
jgi:hypothetical protein